MNTKKILLLTAMLISISSVNAQYIENDTRFDEGAVKATRSLPVTPVTTSLETNVTPVTTSLKTENSLDRNIEITTTDAQIESEEIMTLSEAIEEDERNNQILFWLVGILAFIVVITFVNKKCKLKKD